MEQQKTVLDALMPFFEMTDGLTLSQLCTITQIEPATIQNWVKRGFVSRPVGKRYSKEQSARILMIYALRDTMQLDRIASLISYVNGNLVDTADDIILDSELYQHFCHVTAALTEMGTIDERIMKDTICRELETYGGTAAEKEKLESVLYIMALAYEATSLQRKADTLFRQVIESERGNVK